MQTYGGRALANRDEIAGNLNTSFLKVLALMLMLTDHLGVTLFPGVPELRMIGRMAFPLYAWCLVVGSVKTRNPLRYGLRLLLLAIISQPLYMMALNHTWTELNILFTLLIALISIQGIRLQRYGSQIWVPVLCYVLLGLIKVDYGWRGLTFILLLYLTRGTKPGLIAAYLAYALFWGTSSSSVREILGMELVFLTWPGIGSILTAFFKLQGMIWLSLPLIACKTTEIRLNLPKWLGYGVYPLHFVLLIVLKLLNGYSFEALMRGF